MNTNKKRLLNLLNESTKLARELGLTADISAIHGMLLDEQDSEMAEVEVQYDAALKSDEERRFCLELVEAINKSSSLANKIRFARKPKSFGSTGTSYTKAYSYKDGRREIWVNLAKISGGADKQHPIDFSLVDKIVSFAESNDISKLFQK